MTFNSDEHPLSRAPAGAKSAPAADPTAAKALLETYYACFARKDHRGMAACFHPAVNFRDPIFKLQGKRVAAMWHMLCESGKDMRVEASGIEVENGKGRARWVATYTFSATGRKVVNVIDSRFKFRDGKIVDEWDEFNFWKWSRQALGLSGWVLGWMPRLQQTIQQRAKGNFEKFLAAHPEYAEAEAPAPAAPAAGTEHGV
jgi:ketosteroid isomerase-like protein